MISRYRQQGDGQVLENKGQIKDKRCFTKKPKPANGYTKPSAGTKSGADNGNRILQIGFINLFSCHINRALLRFSMLLNKLLSLKYQCFSVIKMDDMMDKL